MSEVRKGLKFVIDADSYALPDVEECAEAVSWAVRHGYMDVAEALLALAKAVNEHEIDNIDYVPEFGREGIDPPTIVNAPIPSRHIVERPTGVLCPASAPTVSPENGIEVMWCSRPVLSACRACPQDCPTCTLRESTCDCYQHQTDHPGAGARNEGSRLDV